MNKEVKVHIKDSSGDCDTCGYYTSQDIEVYLNDKLILSNHYDGHLGGGDLPYEIADTAFIKNLVEALGYKLTYEVEDLNE